MKRLSAKKITRFFTYNSLISSTIPIMSRATDRSVIKIEQEY